jgi:hypothetical protein
MHSQKCNTTRPCYTQPSTSRYPIATRKHVLTGWARIQRTEIMEVCRDGRTVKKFVAIGAENSGMRGIGT